MYEDMPCIGYYMLVSVLGIIHLSWTTNGKYCIGVGISGKTNDNMGMVEYVADTDECDQQPYGERDTATIQDQKLVSDFCNLLQETNQTGNVKGVSRIHAGNGLIMKNAWSGKRKRFHTMWVFEVYTTFI